MKLDPTISKDRAIPSSKKYAMYFNGLCECAGTTEPRRQSPFLPGAARFAVCGMQKRLA